MRILVTGGNGYVGRELCRQAFGTHDVGVLDVLRCGFNRFAEAERERFRLWPVDLTDGTAVARVIDEFAPQALIHLAAIHFIPECEQHPDQAVATNVQGTVNVLRACPTSCRFVFASSGAVYAPSDLPHREDVSEIAPQDVYGWTKLHGEHFVRHFSSAARFPAAVVRLFNVIGPGETNPHVLPEIVAQLKSGRRVLELGNIEPERDYIDVADAASGFLAVATRGAIAAGSCETVNLGTQQVHSVRQLLDRLQQVSGVAFDVKRDASRLRAVDRPRLQADRRRIGRLFDWEPRHAIDDTLRRTWNDPDLLPELIEKYALGPAS